MEVTDLFLTPIYLIFIYAVAIIIRNRFYANSPLKKYFLPALTAKIVGAISTGLIYQFYYDGGDTFFFYHNSSQIYSFLISEPWTGIRLLMLKSGDYSNPDLQYYLSGFYSWYFKEGSAFFVSKIAALMGLFCFNSYTVISCFFAAFSFYGVWKLFLFFSRLYPSIQKKLAIAILFIPSVCFWGSGIFKDTITLGAIGLLTFYSYKIFIQRQYSLPSILILLLSSYILYVVKVYILFGFLPALILLIFRNFQHKINSKIITAIFTPAIFALTILISYQLITKITESSNKYSLENALSTIQATQNWHTMISPEGSAYTLGAYDPSITGVMTKLPLAVNVTLFGPYIWQVNGFIMLIAAFESMIMLFLTLQTIFKAGIFKMINIIRKDPILIFCFLFSIILAFIVGFTTYNYGALVRYRIPIIPFYLSGIFIVKEIIFQAKSKREVQTQEIGELAISN